MKTIKLSQGKFAIVDDDMFELLNQFKWCTANQSGIYYALRCFKDPDGKWRMRRLHHFIVGCPIKGYEVDHINGNGLDNRRENLRVVSHRRNMWNQRSHRNGTKKSKFIGAHYHPQNKKWQSEINTKGVRKYLGIFNSEIEAHERYMQEVSKAA